MSRDSAYFVTTFQSIIVDLCKPAVRQYTEAAETRACAGYLECFSKPCRQHHLGHACGEKNGNI